MKHHSSAPTMELAISAIDIKKHEGKLVQVVGSIDRVVQTTGPTLFSLVDGSGVLTLKGFEGPGVRAYPKVVLGSTVKALVKIKEFDTLLEGEIMKLLLFEGKEADEIKQHIAKQERERATVTPPVFMTASPILEKLKDRFIAAATEIRLAVIQNRPIIVRHHNDADGYSSGFALELAIIPLITKQHGGGKAPWEYYTRSPCAAPMYEIDDSIRDTAHSLADEAKFSNKMPLVIIADTGSGKEDLLGIQQGRIHGMDFIVVDHHFFGEDVISAETLVHINPFLVNEDGAQYSAGMLCSEFARFINPEVDTSAIAALSGLADRIDNPTVVNAYIKLAEKKGYSKQMLHDIGALIDFVSAKLRFMEAREYIETVFGEPMEKQKKLLGLLAPYIRQLEMKGLAIAESAAQIEKIGSVTLQTLEVEQAFPRFAYPKPGKCVGMLHDKIQESKKLDKVVSVGILADLITIRATDASGFSVHDFMATLKEQLPGAFPDGGGHHRAGAIKFVPNKRADVLKVLREFIKKLK